MTSGLVRGVIEVLTSLCARLCGRRPARIRALRAVRYARRGVGAQAVLAA